MDEAGSAQLPWGIAPSNLKTASLSTISAKKLSAFETGQMGTVKKKSPFQLKKEAEERKKKLADQESAKAYEEFLAHYAAPEPTSKTFVRGGEGDDRDRQYRGDRHRDRDRDRDRGHDRDRDRDRDHDDRHRRYSPPPPSGPGPVAAPPPASSSKKGGKKLSNMELFKQQIQRDQREREARRALKQPEGGGRSVDMGMEALPPPPSDGARGSFDTGDGSTTNLYVGNLAPGMNEQELCKVFGKFGPLASVKIMWPRTTEEKARGRLCGFVAFMKRKDGEACLSALNGKPVQDYEIKLGWGKPVSVPMVPFYVHVATAAGKHIKTGLPFNAQPAVLSLADQTPAQHLQHLSALTKALVIIVIPTDRSVRQLIHRTIEFIIREGPEFEHALIKKVKRDPKFKFLVENDCHEHTYFRWKLFSILQGDRVDRWPEEPFRMFEGGPMWEPPEKETLAITEEVAKGHLSHVDRDTLEKLLRTITPERRDIARLMVFCIGHADAAAEVVECIAESLTILETPIPVKIARLSLISDVLHNCTAHVRNASSYRILIESRLPEIFKALHATFQAIGGRLRAESFRKSVMSCVNAWRDWNVFPPDCCESLETTFQTGGANRNEHDDIDDLDGIPLGGGGGPVVTVDDDDDLDGVPLASASVGSSRSRTQTNHPAKRLASKWENDDSDSDDQNETVRGKRQKNR